MWPLGGREEGRDGEGGEGRVGGEEGREGKEREGEGGRREGGEDV